MRYKLLLLSSWNNEFTEIGTMMRTGYQVYADGNPVGYVEWPDVAKVDANYNSTFFFPALLMNPKCILD